MVSRLKNPYFWVTIVILLATVYLSFGTYVDWFQLGSFVGPFRLNHWLGWTGVVFVAIYTPLYHFLKRRYPKRAKTLLGTHVIGNLLAFMLISVHFASQIGRPAQFFPDLGTGIVLYPIMIILVITGFTQRFQIATKLGRKWRFLHTSMATTFYLVILVHILQGLGFL
jgi:DMSO/TMAO reductase YedYZ heme-binding membrane subunit